MLYCHAIWSAECLTHVSTSYEQNFLYVDDIVVKTKIGSTLIEDLTLVFDRLRTTRTKLNSEKCVFGVSAGKLLGFLVSHRGIEANPAKIKAIEAMRPPGRIKDV